MTTAPPASAAPAADLSALDALPVRDQHTPLHQDRPWIATTIAAITTAGAAVVHVQAAIDYVHRGPVFQGFFVVVALAQIVATVLLILRPRTAGLIALLAGTVALMVLYVLSHTIIIPFLMDMNAHGGDRPQKSDALGVVATVFQLGTVMAVSALLPPRLRSWATNAIAVVAAGLGLAWFAGWL